MTLWLLMTNYSAYNMVIFNNFPHGFPVTFLLKYDNSYLSINILNLFLLFYTITNKWSLTFPYKLESRCILQYEAEYFCLTFTLMKKGHNQFDMRCVHNYLHHNSAY